MSKGMDETRGQQPIITGQQQPPPAYQAPALPPGYQPPYGYAPPAPPRPGRLAVFGRMLRLLLRRFLRGVVLLGRALRPFALPIAITLVLGGVIAWMGWQLWGPKAVAPPDPRVAALPPAPAVESFIQGQRNFNADQMWASFSTGFQSAQLQRGASKDTLQARADNERLRGLKYVNYAYIGGVKLEDGGGMYFYAVDLELQGQRAKLPMIISVDGDGKIVRINWALNEN
jgi:hypothetical protein